MKFPTLRALRFLRAWLRPDDARVRSEEVRFPVGGEAREATLIHPPDDRPAPGWVALHGLTVPGRAHASLHRFARAIAASGATVLVPDVPPWRRLDVAPLEAERTIVAAAKHLAALPSVRPGGVGVFGFSFGATQALVAAADPAVNGAVRAVSGFGGYCDPVRMIRALFVGEHDWRGTRHTFDPDPYGRWILVANFLTRVPGYEGMGDVENAARELALEAGQSGVASREPFFDARKAELRARLATEAERAVWDLVAPPAGPLRRDDPRLRALADAFAEAAPRAEPGLDPRPFLPDVRARIVLAHGVADPTVPFTESLRLREMLAPRADVSLTLTRLFSHSGHGGALHALAYLREGARFLGVMRQALGAT